MKQRKANSGKQVGSQSQPVEPSPATETVLVVALWASPPINDQADDLEAPSGPPSQVAVPSFAIAMVSDLLSVDGGELRESVQDSVSASFRETVYAFNAARHLQRLVRGFSRASTATGPLHASFTLIAASDSDASSFTVNHAHSGQILCAGSLCETIRAIPGLQFTSLPSDPSGGSASHGAVLQLLPPVHMEGYVNEVLEPRIPVLSKPAPGRPMPATGQSGTVPMAGAILPVSAETIPIKTFNPRLVIGGVAGVAVLGTILIFSPLLRNSSRPASQPAQITPTASDRPLGVEPTPALSTPTKQPPLAKAPEPASQKQRDQEHPRPAPAAPAAPTQADADAPRPTRSGVNFNSSEIEDLIVKADRDSGNGAYDRAILEYRTVLNNDPSNALAKKGLAKALYNKSHP